MSNYVLIIINLILRTIMWTLIIQVYYIVVWFWMIGLEWEAKRMDTLYNTKLATKAL